MKFNITAFKQENIGCPDYFPVFLTIRKPEHDEINILAVKRFKIEEDFDFSVILEIMNRNIYACYNGKTERYPYYKTSAK